jgi:hypothetical protein
LWKVAVVVVTIAARRNKILWSSLGLGLSLDLSSDILGDSLCDILGDTLGDILANYGASLREWCSCSCYSCVWYLFCRYGDSLSWAIPLEESSTCLELFFQLETRVYLLVLK